MPAKTVPLREPINIGQYRSDGARLSSAIRPIFGEHWCFATCEKV